ncbi:DUF2155 domain-containing protein [Methyloraptor flagellatus]|uniref:DUF2155 domain-containing protein n=1 Tax=Methyloraptor flagellatus TaxID=3162530 RepID=A0AAU7XDB5_9HYPH
MTFSATGRSRFSPAVRLAVAVLALGVAAGPAFAAGAKIAPPPPSPDDGTKISQPTAVFAGLDKITGRIITFDVAINETVQFGALQVTPRVCYSRPQTIAPLTTSFVEVDEITLENKIRRIFTGWMFADSPGLHAVEHAVYDVWLKDCKGAPETTPAPVAQEAPPAATPAAAPAQGGANGQGSAGQGAAKPQAPKRQNAQPPAAPAIQ